MKWLRKNDSTSHFEDRRGRSLGRGGLVGGGIGAVVIAVISLLMGGDLSSVLNNLVGNAGPGFATQEEYDASRAHENEELKTFTLRVFNSANEVWDDLFSHQLGLDYREPTLVAFTDNVQSSCGAASKEVGPFYCPADEKVYIDMDFFNLLADRFDAPGDLAMAYVTAHEVGHHVQKLLGISDKLNAMNGRVSEAEYNKASVELELNADYLAGVWAYHAERLGIIEIEEGDLEEALAAANAIGDDTLQEEAQGYSVPDSFTHGTSAQRMSAFKRGFTTGDLSNM